MPQYNRKKTLLLASLGAFIFGLAGPAIAETTGGEQQPTWIREAPLANGWPELTPIGRIQVKAYPATRAAVVRESAVSSVEVGELESAAKPQAASGQNRMFWTLFQHINTHDIAMTSPVHMGFLEVDPQSPEASPQHISMAFLYRHTDQGQAGSDGAVSVEDLPSRVYVSIGVRGVYSDEHFKVNLAAIDAWLEEHADAWQADGPPRYLGYNSPMIPNSMKYSEVQRPIKLVVVED